MKKINILKLVGSFAEDKDAAAKLRKDEILPALSQGEQIEFDFTGVTLTTQSFIHALISEALRQNGESALQKMIFKKCDVAVKGIISTVVQYTLETLEDPE